jgi:hypothetical protein
VVAKAEAVSVGQALRSAQAAGRGHANESRVTVGTAQGTLGLRRAVKSMRLRGAGGTGGGSGFAFATAWEGPSGIAFGGGLGIGIGIRARWAFGRAGEGREILLLFGLGFAAGLGLGTRGRGPRRLRGSGEVFVIAGFSDDGWGVADWIWMRARLSGLGPTSDWEWSCTEELSARLRALAGRDWGSSCCWRRAGGSGMTLGIGIAITRPSTRAGSSFLGSNKSGIINEIAELCASSDMCIRDYHHRGGTWTRGPGNVLRRTWRSIARVGPGDAVFREDICVGVCMQKD